MLGKRSRCFLVGYRVRRGLPLCPRGKELPPKLKRALQIQAGVIAPDGQPTTLESYHINQSDEGIDLHGKSGALMATTSMQMQTFVTQPEEDTPIAFAANQRDEVRDLHNVAGALGSQPGMKQQTFIAAGFSAGQGSKAGGIGCQEEIAPTLKGAESGTNMVPSVLCLNDQGGKVMSKNENFSIFSKIRKALRPNGYPIFFVV